jgi:hypothetical protein
LPKRITSAAAELLRLHKLVAFKPVIEFSGAAGIVIAIKKRFLLSPMCA